MIPLMPPTLSLLLCLTPSSSSWLWQPLHVENTTIYECLRAPASACTAQTDTSFSESVWKEKCIQRSIPLDQSAMAKKGQAAGLRNMFELEETVPATGCMLFQPLWVYPCYSLPHMRLYTILTHSPGPS